MLDWLRLIRASGLFTIASNLLAVAFVAAYDKGSLDLKIMAALLVQGSELSLLWVVLTSCLLYASGMLWNDLADAERDRELHPRRPLPSGRISLVTAWVVGVAMAVGALFLAFQLPYGFFAAGIVLSLALLYNLLTKNIPWLGSINMALVRFSHAIFALLLLGSDYLKMGVIGVLGLVGVDLPAGSPALPLTYPLILGTYILGLTLISELESRKGQRWELVFGGLLMLAAVGAAASELVTAHWINQMQQNSQFLSLVASLFLGIAILGFLLWRVGRPWLHALRGSRQALVGPIIGAGLGGIILLDALITTAHHPIGGLLILCLYPPYRLVGRIIRMD